MDKIRDRLWTKAGKKGIPLTVAFELLPVCNLSCKMCYVRKSMAEVQKAGGLISGDRWLEIAKEAADCGLLFPLITGGEPFLHPDFRKIMSGMLDMGMQISINSNGTMIDRETAEWLSTHRPIRINITLYGGSPATYERLCGSADAFDRVKDAVKWLKMYEIPIKFNTSITPDNVADLEEIIAYAKSQECPLQVADYMFPPVRRNADMVGKNERLTPDEAGRVRVRADQLIHGDNFIRAQARFFGRFVPLEQAYDRLTLPDEGIAISCRAGRCSAWIDWQGNLYNCGMSATVKTPLRGRKFAEVWQETVEHTKAFRFSPECLRCANYPLCSPCVAMVSSECGDYGGRPEYICKMNEAIAKYYQAYAEKLPPLADHADLPAMPDERSCDVNDL